MPFNPKWVIGRTITGVQMNPFSDGRGGTVHDPTFILDNGARLRFQTQETNDLEYGTQVLYIPPGKTGRVKAIGTPQVTRRR